MVLATPEDEAEMSDLGGRPGPLVALGGRPGPLFLLSETGAPAFFGGRPRFLGGDGEVTSTFRFLSLVSFGGRPRLMCVGLIPAAFGGRPLFLGELDSLELADFGGRPRFRGEGLGRRVVVLVERRTPVFVGDLDDFVWCLLGEEWLELTILASLFASEVSNLDRRLANMVVEARRVDVFVLSILLQVGQSHLSFASGIDVRPTQKE
jgi:hypothetical protein